jgi:hypothetical protein
MNNRGLGPADTQAAQPQIILSIKYVPLLTSIPDTKGTKCRYVLQLQPRVIAAVHIKDSFER